MRFHLGREGAKSLRCPPSELPITQRHILIAQALQASLPEAVYDTKNAAGLNSSVTDSVFKGLTALLRPYKFVVACVVLQRAGGGVHAAASALWDVKKDGICSMTCEIETMHCFVTVAGLAFSPSVAAAES